MSDRKMDAIQVQDTVVSQKWTLSPRFKLLGQRLVEPADCTRPGSHSHEGGSNLSDFMGARPTHKHLGQRFSNLRLIAVIALKHLAVKLPFSISGDLEIFNVSRRGYQIARVGTIAVSTAIGSAFSPGCSNTLL